MSVITSEWVSAGKTLKFLELIKSFLFSLMTLIAPILIDLL